VTSTLHSSTILLLRCCRASVSARACISSSRPVQSRTTASSNTPSSLPPIRASSRRLNSARSASRRISSSVRARFCRLAGEEEEAAACSAAHRRAVARSASLSTSWSRNIWRLVKACLHKGHAQDLTFSTQSRQKRCEQGNITASVRESRQMLQRSSFRSWSKASSIVFQIKKASRLVGP
jgi:hypothetical protein